MQQSIRESLYSELERSNHPFSGMIHFTDQAPNRVLARKASRDGSLATLDLSEASDRVSNQHVRLLFASTPFLSGVVQAVRSRKADVDGHGVIRLSKYASMGSALTFPIEAMVFLTIIFMAISEELNTPLSEKLIKSFKGRVRVYGDDIVVPVEFADCVIRRLSDFGHRVNTGKSFWNGKFRESCGGDYYDGHDVTVVKVRRLFPESRRDAEAVLSTVSLSNQLYKAGCWRAADFVANELNRKKIPTPLVSEDSPVHGLVSYMGVTPSTRTCEFLQIPLVYGIVETSKPPRNSISGLPALNKTLVSDLDTLGVRFLDPEHLERSGRPRTVRITSKWARQV
jgi:hypothetical protein